MPSHFDLAACAEMLWRDRPVDWRASRLKDMGFGVGLWNWPAHDLVKLEKTGATFTIMNGYLQGRLAGRDWGLMENTKIVPLKEGPAPVALQISLPIVAEKTDGGAAARSGMGFTWLPSKLQTAKAACLTYSVWLPEDFNFGTGGSLPGLFGGETTDTPTLKAKAAFSARNSWTDEGVAQVRTMTADDPKGANYSPDTSHAILPRGRWVRLEQEVVLNQPGEVDGVLRVWVDGKLRVANTEIMFRKDERSTLRGVIADVHYSNAAMAAAPSPKTTSLRLTPFELYWQ